MSELTRSTASFNPGCVLVTGGAGFIGSNFIRYVLDVSDATVVNLDSLTYAGNLDNLKTVCQDHGEAGDGRYFFLKGDVRDEGLVAKVFAGVATETGDNISPRGIPEPDCVVHLAAESHVDRALDTPGAFVETNVGGTRVLLDACLRSGGCRFLHVSTDEVYGSLNEDSTHFDELAPLSPSNVYSASKAAADLIVRAYNLTNGLPTIIARCSNNYGPRQFPEKLIPLVVTRALQGKDVPVYGDGGNVRDWVFVDDHVAALWALLKRGRVGEVYNIGGGAKRDNLGLIRTILEIMDKPYSLIRFVDDRPNHDRSYGVDFSKIGSELGWNPTIALREGLERTVQWYSENSGWWEKVISEAYRVANSRYL